MSQDKFRKVFIEESLEGLQQAEEDLLALEKDTGNQNILNSLFRTIHTIKGGAGMVNMPEVGELSHSMENILSEVRQKGTLLKSEDLDILLAATDILKQLIESEGEALSALQAKYDATIKALQGLELISIDSDTGEDEEDCEFIRVFSQEMKNSIESGEKNLYLLKITLSEDCLIKSARVYLALEVINDLLDIVKVAPSMKDIEDEKMENTFKVWGCGSIDNEEITDIVADVSEVEQVEVALTTIVEMDEMLSTEKTDDKDAFGLFEDEGKAGEKEVQLAGLALEKDENGNNNRAVHKNGSENEQLDSIRVKTSKLENILDSVGELIISQSRLKDMVFKINDGELELDMELVGAFEESDKIIRNLQEDVMNASMIPIGGTFIRFQRMVRDQARELGKEIELEINGKETELDKKIIEQIIDPLKHLVRNSVGHGIEEAEERLAKGKPAKGTISLNAYHSEGNIVIEISDDGKGIDEDAILKKAIERGLVNEDESLDSASIRQLIFQPGFSTSEKLSDLSGRGVGLDVVMNNITNLSGKVELTSEKDKGTTFIIRLPLTVAIIDGMMVRVGEEHFIVPLNSIVEFVKAEPEDIRRVEGRGKILSLREEFISFMSLFSLFNLQPDSYNDSDGIILILKEGKKKMALLVDEIIGQEQVVIKSVKEHLEQIEGIAGATIMGDGRVTVILDIVSLFRLVRHFSAFNRIDVNNSELMAGTTV